MTGWADEESAAVTLRPAEEREPAPTPVDVGPGGGGGEAATGPRHAPAPRRRRRTQSVSVPADAASRILLGVVGVLIACVTVFGSITAANYPRFSEIDEAAHFAYIQQIAEHATLPVLNHSFLSEPVLAIRKGVYPRPSHIDARTAGLSGASYEAFQPPLYYVLAVPAFELSGNYHTKVVSVRFFDLVLLLASIALFARLCRAVMKERWLWGLATGMLVFAMPNVVVRSVTVSNLSLAMPITIAFATEAWLAWEHRSARRLIGAGALVGVGLLTDLFTLALVPAFVGVAVAVLVANHRRRDVLAAGAAGAVAAVIIAPWVAFNEIHYHALTGSAVAKAQQLSTVNPHHVHYSLKLAATDTVNLLFQPVMTQEWTLAHHQVLAWMSSLLAAFIIPVGLVFGVSMGRRLITSGLWIFAIPFVADVALCVGITVFAQWQSMVPRYMNFTLPLLALFLAAAALPQLRTVRPYLLSLSIFAVFLVVLWFAVLPQLQTS